MKKPDDKKPVPMQCHLSFTWAIILSIFILFYSILLESKTEQMIKKLSGALFITASGEILVYNEQDESLSLNDVIFYDGSEREIQNILPPSKPDGKWAVELKKT